MQQGVLKEGVGHGEGPTASDSGPGQADMAVPHTKPMQYAPKTDPFLSPAGWTALAIFALITLLIVPSLFVFVPEDSPFHVSAFTVTLVGKIMCYCIVAVAMNLVWGYAGILSLGHGVFFALGGYAFGMYLMRQIGVPE
jgi:urea transport system permease protein